MKKLMAVISVTVAVALGAPLVAEAGQCLLLIKQLQEERFMPLRVIKSMLDDDPERARALVELEVAASHGPEIAQTVNKGAHCDVDGVGAGELGEGCIGRDVSDTGGPPTRLRLTGAGKHREPQDDDGEPAQVAERLVDLDEGLQEWRYRHVKMVERTIGDKPGTGGSAGVASPSARSNRPAELSRMSTGAPSSCTAAANVGVERRRALHHLLTSSAVTAGL